MLDPDDAERIVDLGAIGVVVSNHGGRQLNAVLPALPALPALRALPAVAERIGHRAQVLVDGGVRSGSDVVVALALGADACPVGRPLVYGLAGGGERGVADVLRILREELTRNLTMMGVRAPGDLDRSSVTPRHGR